ncbi:hypothetical protein FRX31_011562 [Thalictrum thalictroides]|uniref:Uncharacterized protein n=1 Tax=Thalictrum thalictroides TaxID=46969 RepID=A0A7J6WN88_THATH|nr:hypothetical protein FRX31_011562 [Thalictrum thalictroides]
MSQTNARYYQIKHELSNMKKGSSTISEYMDRIKMLSGELSLIQYPLTTRDLVGCVLDGLDLDYDVVVNTVQAMCSPPSFEKLYSMLLNREKHLEIYHQPQSDRETNALFVSNNRGHGRSNSRCRGNGRGSYRGRGTGRFL